MSRKFDLKIDTQFYGEQEHNYVREIENMQYSPTFPVQKMTSAAMFERLLSSNLAEKFIDCWRTLKNSQGRHRQHLRQDLYLHGEDQRGYNEINFSRRNYGQKSGVKDEQKRKSHKNTARNMHKEEERVIYRNKSADLKIQLSRAKILSKIAEKLKQNRVITPKSEKNDYEVTERLNKLQRIMKEIRVTNEISQERAINSRISYEKKQKDELQIMKMLQEVSSLKRQIIDIKNQNQLIMKTQSERVRSSSVRQTVKETQKRDHQYVYPNQNMNLHNNLYPNPNVYSNFQGNLYPNNNIYHRQDHQFITHQPTHFVKPVQTINSNYIPIRPPTYRPMEDNQRNPTIVTSKPQYLPNQGPFSGNSNFLRAPSLENNNNIYKMPVNNNPITIKYPFTSNSSGSNWKPPSNLVTSIPIITVTKRMCDHCGRSCGCQPMNKF